jgi:lipopolysaccharide/colanic/teichoic acid biosynthesis glycosyltransferase
MYLGFLKPFFDFIFAVFGFLTLLPVFLLCVVLLLFTNKGNPFFFQKRPGKHGNIFTIIKFKTMNDRRNSDGNLLPDAQRLTVVGKFIRSTSLDEIPQLLNVLNGDMSFVGPRPLLPEYLPLYNEFQKQRHQVKPGITGWAQVNGRNAISWNEKFELDVFYVQNVTFALDLKIIFKTIGKVFLRTDINTKNQVTTHRFKGNNT